CGKILLSKISDNSGQTYRAENLGSFKPATSSKDRLRRKFPSVAVLLALFAVAALMAVAGHFQRSATPSSSLPAQFYESLRNDLVTEPLSLSPLAPLSPPPPCLCYLDKQGRTKCPGCNE